ncbi:hypothetical protein NM688_g1579 [Phlebia brevispora]|uniref:Uncharacterized protein n=1 Tax=Phlebia brevispora TaxID=194682 RepID=A0ACC1TBE3_9APHY|nr:hypothetical protein NM688_g1579 [Phlebia brevispora]
MPVYDLKVPQRNEGTDHADHEAHEIVIAVMGATGSGKSTFINLVSGSNLAVGNDLKSCTSNVQSGDTFYLFNRAITLIDTPGFGDTNVSDSDILNKIAVFLSTTYEHGQKLSGIIWMHRISDRRVRGIAKRNFDMFQKLCGEASLRNVAIVTNMWNEVTPERGADREHQLRTDEILFKPAIVQGAEMFRHDRTLQSAQKIVQYLVNRHPRVLRIQEELVNEKKDVKQTAAGLELDRELAERVKMHERELEKLKRDMEEVIAAKDKRIQNLEAEVKRIQNERDRLLDHYEEQKKKVDALLKELQRERSKPSGLFRRVARIFNWSRDAK